MTLASEGLTEAEKAVASIARRTPLLSDPGLSERFGREVLVKAECLQVTGSFKVRGAAARLARLTAAEKKRGVVACSSGNHGRAVAFVAQEWGVPATIYVPEWVDPVKLAGIEASGADAILAGSTFDESEALAMREADASGREYVSAYDDPDVILGQATIGLEILDQLGSAPACLLAPLSGGGLIGGVALAFADRLDQAAPPCIAVSAQNAGVMLASIEAGHPVELPEEETLANALAGGIGLDNRHSFELVRDRIARHVSVNEAQIAQAMRYCVQRLHLVVEGGGAVALAALLSGTWQPDATLSDAPVVVVLSGGNVATKTLVDVLADGS